MEPSVRASWHCGYMQPEERAAVCELPDKIGPYDIRPLGVCPGWAVRQQLVSEAAAAFDPFRLGCFDSFYPNPPNVIIEGVQVLHRACERKSADELKAMRDKHGS